MAVAGLLGLVIGGSLGWFLIADTYKRNLEVSLAWGDGWGQVVLLVGGAFVVGFVAPGFTIAAGSLLALGSLVAGVMALFTEQARFAPILFVMAVGSLVAVAFAARRSAELQSQRAQYFEQYAQEAAARMLRAASPKVVSPPPAPQAKAAVHRELGAGEGIIAEGAVTDLGLGGHRGWAAVTGRGRLVWAIEAEPRVAMNIVLSRVVSHRQDGTTHYLTERDPAYAASLADPSNPAGEVDAALRFEFRAVSEALAAAMLRARPNPSLEPDRFPIPKAVEARLSSSNLADVPTAVRIGSPHDSSDTEVKEALRKLGVLPPSTNYGVVYRACFEPFVEPDEEPLHLRFGRVALAVGHGEALPDNWGPTEEAWVLVTSAAVRWHMVTDRVPGMPPRSPMEEIVAGVREAFYRWGLRVRDVRSRGPGGIPMRGLMLERRDEEEDMWWRHVILFAADPSTDALVEDLKRWTVSLGGSVLTSSDGRGPD